MMPFIRNDTLMQYGRYGFWQTRDFFTFFMPTSGGGSWHKAQGGWQLSTNLTFSIAKVTNFIFLIGHGEIPHKIIPLSYQTVCIASIGRTDNGKPLARKMKEMNFKFRSKHSPGTGMTCHGCFPEVTN